MLILKKLSNAFRQQRRKENFISISHRCILLRAIYVSDTGNGIPKDKLGHIFERFLQLNEFEPRTGLGLSICKGLVGWRYHSKELGEGKSFSVSNYP